MTNYVNIQFLGSDYYDVDVEYDVIDGDDSVGLPVDYEFSATVVDEDDNVIDITNDLTEEEVQEVYDAIKKDMNKTEWD